MLVYMSEYHRLEKDALIAQLMDYTQKIIKMVASGIYEGQDFCFCRDTILAIQNEIKKREPLLEGGESTPFLNPDSTGQELTA